MNSRGTKTTSFRDWRLTGLGYLGARTPDSRGEEALKQGPCFKRLSPPEGGILTEVIVRRRFDRTPVRVELKRPRATVEDVLRAKGIRPDSVVVVRGQTPIPITDRVEDGEELELLEVVSGG